jgi:6-phosphogluconate dehydrogenase
MIQNILTFRFSNNLFEANWSNETIESIDIRLWENLGVEERGSFYDGVGALRDVGQNHLLQMLAFVTMDEPDHRSPEAIREKRAELLQGLEIPTPSTIKEGTFRAQYEGYRSIKNVQPDSSTETYFKIRTKLTSPRWRGVDITLESGKRMGEQRKEIVVNFKHPSPCLCPPESKEHFKNRVIFSMEPIEGIKIEFWSKKPGLEFDTEKRSFDFLLRTGTEKKQYVEEYKKLLLECIQGDQTLFISTEEMKAMWDFVDPITKAWQKNVAPLHTYTPGSAEIALKALENNVEKVVEVKKEIGVIGLGKMGANMVRRLLEKGWKVVGYNRSKEIIDELAVFGMVPAYSVQELVQKLSPERLVWVMLPAGEVTEEMLFSEKGVVRLLQKGDTIIDGGNSFYKDTERRGRELEKIGINFFDVGTSGGPGGARHGACLMIGGEEALFKKYRSLFEDFSNGTSYQFFKGAGAGHFVKMIHNGIEYGMMQAIAEGFHILKEARFNLNLTDVTSIYNNGSVIESRLIGWLEKGLEIHGADLGDVPGKVGYTGEGEWTVKTAHEMKLQAKIIEESLKFRINSQENPDYTGKVLMTLREQFGGHKK